MRIKIPFRYGRRAHGLQVIVGRSVQCILHVFRVYNVRELTRELKI